MSRYFYPSLWNTYSDQSELPPNPPNLVIPLPNTKYEKPKKPYARCDLFLLNSLTCAFFLASLPRNPIVALNIVNPMTNSSLWSLPPKTAMPSMLVAPLFKPYAHCSQHWNLTLKSYIKLDLLHIENHTPKDHHLSPFFMLLTCLHSSYGHLGSSQAKAFTYVCFAALDGYRYRFACF